MTVCTGPMYTCGKKQKLTSATSSTLSQRQIADRVFTLQCGSREIVINKRTRDYLYTQNESMNKAGLLFLYRTGEGTTECADFTENVNGSISEQYTTVDVTFHYVDLRNDLIVYTESTQTMQFAGANSGGTIANKDGSRPGADIYGHTGGLVYMSPYSVPRVPFVFEEVPITVVNKIICTTISQPLHEETVNSGYWDGIRVLMPGFIDGAPFARPFSFDGVEYEDASAVDWYYLPNHVAADGDYYSWWADWHKAVGVNLEIDATAAEKIADIFTTGGKYASSNGMVKTDFIGSAAVDKAENLFFSAAFDTASGKIILNKLVADGSETPIPTEKIQVEQPDGTFIEQDSEHTCYYPIAPL